MYDICAHYLFPGILQVISLWLAKFSELHTYLSICSLRHIIKTRRRELKPANFQTSPSLIPSAWIFSASAQIIRAKTGLLLPWPLGT